MQKGGVLRQWAPGSYPDTFRPNGPNSNSGFRGPLYDEIIIGLVSIHPVTGKSFQESLINGRNPQTGALFTSNWIRMPAIRTEPR